MKTKLSYAFITAFSFISFVSFSQSVVTPTEGIKDTYKAESNGYFISPQQTSVGLIATNNFGSKIYLVKNNGLQEIVALPGCGRYCALSGDKSKVGFKYINSNGEQVPAVYDLAANKISTLSNPLTLCGQVSFSTNGSIAYTSGNILNIINGNNIKTIDLGTYSNITPISPDANFVIFNSNNDQLFIVDLITNSKKQITNGMGGYVYPQWSPDGNKVMYSSLSGNLFVWDRTSNSTYSLGTGKNANWSGDSKSVLFDRTFIEGSNFKGADIFLASFDGTKIANITNTPNENEMYPSFGSGNTIVYSAYGKAEIISSGLDIQTQTLTSTNLLIEKKSSLLNSSDHFSFSENNRVSNTMVQGTVPYVNQVYDVPSWHDGNASCAAASAVMALAYYNKLPYWDITCYSPSSHTSHYGSYIADRYNTNEMYYNSTAADWGGNTSYGAYGYMWNGSNSPSSRMSTYINNHGVNSVQSFSTVFTDVISKIDQDYPFPICNMLTSYGHLILAVGYINATQHTIIFNDPYGNKNLGYWPNATGANSYYDWPGYNNGYQNLNQIAWTVTADAPQPTSNDTIVDDTYYNKGFYMYNKGVALMRYYQDKKTGGYKSHFWYTLTNASAATDTCYVTWTPTIPATTNYEVFAYVPATNATTSSAKYKINYRGGNTTVIIDQAANAGKWVSLGTYSFTMGTSNSIRLGDATGQAGKSIAFDAIKWSRVGAATDNVDPTTAISAPTTWITQSSFTANFTDADNTGGSGIEKSMYHVVDYDGTEWRANNALGFFRDNFDNAIHSDWTKNTGTWAIVGGVLQQSDESVANSNISAPLTQNLSNRYLYNWSGKIEGAGTSRRAGFHFMCDNATSPNRGNGYFVWVRADQSVVEIYKSVNDVLGSAVQTAPVTITAGTFYDYKVVYDRSTGEISVYVNNSLITSWTDSSPITNGSYISFRNGDSKYSVNNFYVYRSRSTSSTISVGAASTNAIRFQNASPSQPSGMIKSIVMDKAGNLSGVASQSVDVDWTAPADVTVIKDGTGNDISSTNSTTQLSANWNASSDTHSDVVKYYYAIGKTAGATDVVNWTSNALSTAVTKTGLNLTVGQVYYFSVKAENGAGLQSAVMSSNGQIVQISTGIEEAGSTIFQIYPNPANDHLTLLLPGNTSKMEVAIYNLLGEKQLSVQATDQQTTIDVTNLATGVYIIEVISENKISRQKFIKQ
jgi:hypothetical protein